MIEFVNREGERLVRDAAVALAQQFAAQVAAAYANEYGGAKVDDGYADDAGKPVDGAEGIVEDETAKADTGYGDWRPKHRGCKRRPTEFKVTFENLSRRDIRFLTEQMDNWPCRLAIDLDNASPSQASYVYKVRANEAQLCRSLEISLEFMGLVGSCNTRGRNELVVDVVPLRRN